MPRTLTMLAVKSSQDSMIVLARSSKRLLGRSALAVFTSIAAARIRRAKSVERSFIVSKGEEASEERFYKQGAGGD